VTWQAVIRDGGPDVTDGAAVARDRRGYRHTEELIGDEFTKVGLLRPDPYIPRYVGLR